MTEIEKKARELAELIAQECRPGREKSLAYTKLEECIMWVRASKEKNKKGDKP